MNISDNDFFRQATLKIYSTLNIQTAMTRLMDYLKDYFPISGVFFGVYDPEINVGRILASIWPKDIKQPGPMISFPQEFWHFIKETWHEKKTVTIINDLDQEPSGLQEILGQIWQKDYSHMNIQLQLDQKRLGNFGIFAPQKHQYTPLHAHLLSLLHDPLAIAINNILQHQEIKRLQEMLADDNRYLKRQMLEMTGETIIGADFGLKDVMQMVTQVAPATSPVLLTGETGVGKEIIANAIHSYSGRRDNPLIKVNCGAIPENLIDSELFGHEKGAFTGALNRKRGRFERAHTGTIFLDEIGELPLPAQVRLLRVLQQHEIERVGGAEVIPVDVRIISATNRNLEKLVNKGLFREDLWFRLNVFPITIPPLRQRKGDIPSLLSHFLERKSKDLKLRQIPHLTPEAMEELQRYHWPGNVRELENIVERALILNLVNLEQGNLSFDLFQLKTPSINLRMAEEEDLDEIAPLNDIISSHIRKALQMANGKVEGSSGAAKMLGLNPSTLRGKLKKFKIPYGRKTKIPSQA